MKKPTCLAIVKLSNNDKRVPVITVVQGFNSHLSIAICENKNVFNCVRGRESITIATSVYMCYAFYKTLFISCGQSLMVIT